MARFRKGVRLKNAGPIKCTTEARGLVAKPRALYSGQSLSEIERRQEAQIMAVALAQPHRETAYDGEGRMVASSDSRRLGTALGRFCARHKPKPLAPWLEDAGNEYAAVVYRYKRALGFQTFRNSGDPLACPPDDETSSARREKAEMDKRRIDDELARIDRRGPIMMEALCFDEIEAPEHWGKILVDCLLAASDHFGLSPKNIRDARF